MVKSILWKFLSVEPFCSTSSQQFKRLQEFQNNSPSEQDFYGISSWILNLHFVSDEKTLILNLVHFFFPGDIFWFRTQYYFSQQFCLQLNENTNGTLMSYTVCQGENYLFTCRVHSHFCLFISIPSCIPSCVGLWLASDIYILMSAPQISQTQASEMATNIHQLEQPDFSIQRGEQLKYLTHSPRMHEKQVWNICPRITRKQKSCPIYQKQGETLPLGYAIWLCKQYHYPQAKYFDTWRIQQFCLIPILSL